MNNLKLRTLFKELANLDIFINTFPNSAGTNVKFTIVDSNTEGQDLTTYYVRFLSKGTHPKTAETPLNEIVKTINGKTNYLFNGGRDQLVLATCESTIPFFEGEINNGEYLYSLEMDIITLSLGGDSSE